ncbi:MAG: zinc ribbon domain-containing protein [Pseudomonadota bacterium]
MSGIQSIASYVPRFCMQRQTIAAQLSWFDPGLKSQAMGSRSVANWDEDAITMAVAAGRTCCAQAGKTPQNLVFATTTAPFLDRSNATLIVEALSLPAETSTAESSGSQRAASSALLSGLRAATPMLLAASDRRGAKPGSARELSFGDAAAAVLIGADDGLARFLGGATLASDFVDHYRTAEQDTDYVFEDRWVRDVGSTGLIPQTVAQAAADAERKVADIDHLLLPIAGHHAKAVVKSLGLQLDVLGNNLFAELGDSGVGHGLLMLDECLRGAKAGELVCLVGFGQGCDAMLFEVTNTQLTDGESPSSQAGSAMELADYLKLPAFSRQLTLASGIRAEADKRTSISAFYRHHHAVNAMQGSVCTACDTPHFPPARVCVNCHATDQMSDYPFADKVATVKSFTEDWQTATPSPPMCYGNVEFEGGGNAFLELSDVPLGSLQVGDQLAMQFRIKDFDDKRGFRRYFWKPVPMTVNTSNDDGASNG